MVGWQLLDTSKITRLALAQQTAPSGRGSTPSALPYPSACEHVLLQNPRPDAKYGVFMPCACPSPITKIPFPVYSKTARSWLCRAGMILSQGSAKLSISQMLSQFLNQPGTMINEIIMPIMYILLTFINCIK